jgi:hypothetical protein
MPAVADMFSPFSVSQRRFVDAVRALGPEFQQRGPPSGVTDCERL